MTGESERAWQARNLRYKKGALATLGWEFMIEEFYKIEEECADVHWYFEGENGDSLLAAMDGEEDEALEVKMAFAQLEADCGNVREMIDEIRYYEEDVGKDYDDCTVNLIGNRYEILGFDKEQEDYFSLTHFEQDLSVSEAGKRLMRLTKAEMLEKIGRCMSIAFAFIDLRDRYDHLKATFDVLRGENMSILQRLKEIEKEYEKMMDNGDERQFERILCALPDRIWVE